MTPRRYKMAGAVIASTFELPELVGGPVPGAADPTDLVISVDAAPDPGWLDDGEVISSSSDVELRKVADGFLLDLDDCVMRLSADGGFVRAWSAAGLDPSSFRHTLLDVVVPYALALQGRTVLHATAVSLDGRALAFLGHSGEGKSTLAAAVVRHAGGLLLADDCLCLAEVDGALVVEPSYPGLRLRPDSRAAVFGAGPATDRKALVLPSSLTYRAELVQVPLAAILVLERRPDVAGVDLKALGTAEAFMAVTQHRLQLDVMPAVHARLLEQFGAVVARVPVFRLRFGGNLQSVASLVDAALGALRGLDNFSLLPVTDEGLFG